MSHTMEEVIKPFELGPNEFRVKSNAADILHEAACTIERRAAERDLPAERSMGRTVKAFNALMGTSLTETQGWLFMVILKLARETAGRHNRDDLLDAAAYAALALEAEEK